jgi:hypothetical protein
MVIVVRRQSRLKTAAVNILELVLLGAIYALFACSAGSEEVGRIHVTPAEVAGVCRLDSEQLELQSNGTYVQDDISDSAPLHHTGQWRMLNVFDGSEVLLLNASVTPIPTPNDERPHRIYGDLPMYAHTFWQSRPCPKRGCRVALRTGAVRLNPPDRCRFVYGATFRERNLSGGIEKETFKSRVKFP